MDPTVSARTAPAAAMTATGCWSGWPIRCRPSSICSALRCCPGWSTSSPTTGATADETSACSKSARDSRGGRRAPRPGVRLDRGGTRRALVEERPRGGFLRRQGARRAAVRGAGRSRDVWRRRPSPISSPARRRLSRSGTLSIGLVGLLSPAIAEARGAPRQDHIFVAELDLEPIARVSRRARRMRCGRCPAIPSVVRDLSIVVLNPCLRRSFVAPFRRLPSTRTRRSSSSPSSIATRARVSARVRSASRCG